MMFSIRKKIREPNQFEDYYIRISADADNSI